MEDRIFQGSSRGESTGLAPASFNHVVFRDPFVLAATGRAGVQIYRMG